MPRPAFLISSSFVCRLALWERTSLFATIVFTLLGNQHLYKIFSSVLMTPVALADAKLTLFLTTGQGLPTVFIKFERNRTESPDKGGMSWILFDAEITNHHFRYDGKTLKQLQARTCRFIAISLLSSTGETGIINANHRSAHTSVKRVRICLTKSGKQFSDWSPMGATLALCWLGKKCLK